LRIGAAEFFAGVLGGEFPLHPNACLIALALPGVDFGDQRFAFTDTAGEALAPQHADFDFHHVQPAGVLGQG
jgi:hypothetical protein